MIGLYVHIPFCRQKCGYCDFISYAGREELADAYSDAVVKEAEVYRGETADTVFIGGGTPSLLGEGKLERLMDGIQKSIAVAPGAEFTIEANPESTTKEKAAEYLRFGANRISMGLQAVQDEILRRIGRIHTYADFLRALDDVLTAGFENINADIMYSLPGQTLEQAEETAVTAAALPLSHISAYALKLEKGTPMYGAKQPGEELDRQMFHAIEAILENKGFYRYEISNFARAGRECTHNLKYWTIEDYIGLGAAAHSCYRGRRFSNEDDLAAYLRAVGGEGTAKVTNIAVGEYDRLFEKIMLMTRLTRGIPMRELPNKPKLMRCIDRLQSLGLCVARENLRLTERGLDVQDSVVLELVSCI